MLTVAKSVYLSSCHEHTIEVNRPGFVGTTQFQNGSLSSGGTHSSALLSANEANVQCFMSIP